MIRIVKVILVFLISVLTYGQQIDGFITRAVMNNPGKAIDSLAGVIVITPYEAAKNYYVIGKCHAFLNQEERGLNYFFLSKKGFEQLGEIALAKQIALEAHKIIAAQEHYGYYGNTLLEEFNRYADSINSSLYKAYAVSEFAKNDYYTYDDTRDIKYLYSAYYLYKTALSHANETNDDLIKAKLYSNIGSLKNTMGQCDSARFYLDKSKVYIDKIDDNYERYAYYHNYANSYFFEEKYQKAIPYFLKAKEVVPYYKGKALRALYGQLEEAYDFLDNHTERRKYQKLYDSIDIIIEDRIQNVKMHESYVKYDVEEKDEKISMLQKIVDNFNRHKLIYGIALFLVFLLALYSFVRWKKVDARRKKLQSEHETVQAEHEKTVKQLESVKQLVIEDHLVLKNKTKLYVNSLLYIKSEDHYLNFITTEGKHHFLRGKLKEIAEQLPPNFKKCHRSYIVNTNYIKNTSSKGITLINNELIPVSRNFKI